MSELLWAGWRMKYIESAKCKECLFCGKVDARPGKSNLVLTVSEKCLVMLNAFPYNCGHLMIAPKRHVGTVSGLTEGESCDLMRQLSLCERILRKAYRAQGFNVGLNLGRCAGAGVLGHLHVHVVPRWSGDTNFMSTVSGTKVLPESLVDTYAKLKAALDEIVSPSRKGSIRQRHGSKKERTS
ncbi:MAG: HIT domain-containing protein [Candidatus Eisenbacteria bacterium]|nr:HIT domain-containing protein [Candidatus Eisenbacteria bacterium]